MDIIKIVKENLDEKYGKLNWLYKVCMYLLNKCIYFLNRCFFCYVKLIKNKFKNIETKSKCVLINSPWGSGKTYRFKHNLQPIFESNGYRCVYISLFGIKTIDELKMKLINNCLNHKYKVFLLFFIPILIVLIFCTYGFDLAVAFEHKIIIKLFSPFYILIFGCFLWLIFKFMKLNFIKTILLALSNKFLGSGIPMNKSEIGELFNPYCDIFVFDDLERISDDCKIREIIGFIADLKYIYGFNILIIGDESHISKNHLEEYNLYKEKLIDYEKNDILITEGVFNSIVEQINNEKVKQLVIDGLKPHIDFNGTGKMPITKNLRLILRCIDDIQRLIDDIDKNESLKDSDIYWFDGNYKKKLLDILKLSKETNFIKNSTVIYWIDKTFTQYYEASLSKEELEKQENSLFNIDFRCLSHLTPSDIKKEFCSNKLQILNDYCCRHIEDSISPEICNQIIDNLIDCKSLLINFGNDYSEYFNSFKNLCFYLEKDISDYFYLFNSTTLDILKNSYNSFYELVELCNIHHFPKEISNIVRKNIDDYKLENVIKFLKEELKVIDNRISKGDSVDTDIYYLLDKFFSFFTKVCIINKNAFEEIDFNSYKNYKEIKIFLINTLYDRVQTYFGSFDKQDIVDMVYRLSKFYSSRIERFRLNAIIKETENLENHP